MRSKQKKISASTIKELIKANNNNKSIKTQDLYKHDPETKKDLIKIFLYTITVVILLIALKQYQIDYKYIVQFFTNYESVLQ